MIKTTVEKILQEYESPRNSDKWLMILFMEAHGIELTQGQKYRFLAMPSLESARRERQKFQEKGFYLATPKVQEKRSEMEENIRQGIKHAEPGDTRHLFEAMGVSKENPVKSVQTLFDIPRRNG